MKLRVIILFCIITVNGFAQSSFRRSNIDFLSFETGLTVDAYNSLNARMAFEYQKQLSPKWLYGISYEHTSHYDYAFRDKDYELPTNFSLLSLNGYYRINLTKRLLFLTAGAGVGLVHLNWLKNDKVGLTANASLTLNIKLTERVYIITSPLLVLTPSNRIYVSPIKIKNFSSFYTYSAFPLGIKVQL